MLRQSKKAGFYGRSLTPEERKQLPAARRMEGLDEEVAVLRVRMRSLLAKRPDDFALLEKTLTTLARTLAIRHRISPQSAKDLGERMALTLQSIGDQILPPE